MRGNISSGCNEKGEIISTDKTLAAKVSKDKGPLSCNNKFSRLSGAYRIWKNIYFQSDPWLKIPCSNYAIKIERMLGKCSCLHQRWHFKLVGKETIICSHYWKIG